MDSWPFPKLCYPPADLNIQKEEQGYTIWDMVRKKRLVLQPEEWVRQHLVHYLVNHLDYPKAMISMEKELKIGSTRHRFDLLVFNRKMQPALLAELKAPEVSINQKVFDQASRYNYLLKVPYLILSNGMEHFVCKVNDEDQEFEFLPDVPSYNSLNI